MMRVGLGFLILGLQLSATQLHASDPMRTVLAASPEGFSGSLHHVSQDAWQQREIIQTGVDRWVLFFPSIRAAGMNESYSQGPIRQVTIRSVERGVVVVLKARQSLHQKLDYLLQRDFETGMIELRVRQPQQKLEASEARQGPKSNVVKAKAVHDSGAGGFAWLDRLRQGPEDEVLEQSSVQAMRPAKPLVATGLLGLGLSGLGGVAWMARRKRQLAKLGAKISILEVKAIAGRHRLVLVETCGERLLLAASEQEVTVLTHMGQSMSADVADLTHDVDARARTEDVTPGTCLGSVVAAAAEPSVASSDADSGASESVEWNPALLSGLPPQIANDVGFVQDVEAPSHDGTTARDAAAETPSESRYRSDIQGLLTLKSNRVEPEASLFPSEHARNSYSRVRDHDAAQGAA